MCLAAFWAGRRRSWSAFWCESVVFGAQKLHGLRLFFFLHRCFELRAFPLEPKAWDDRKNL